MTTLDDALVFTMQYEVGPWFNAADPETKAGLCTTPAQKKKTGYTNDLLDAGGETKFGVARTANPGVDIKTLTWDQATKIYEAKYWNIGKCDQFETKLAKAHFDACVNHGPKKAAQFLQRAVGVVDDGDLGPKSLAAIKAKPDVLSAALQERRKFFNAIVASNHSQAKFLKGWLARVDDLQRKLA